MHATSVLEDESTDTISVRRVSSCAVAASRFCLSLCCLCKREEIRECDGDEEGVKRMRERENERENEREKGRERGGERGRERGREREGLSVCESERGEGDTEGEHVHTCVCVRAHACSPQEQGRQRKIQRRRKRGRDWHKERNLKEDLKKIQTASTERERAREASERERDRIKKPAGRTEEHLDGHQYPKSHRLTHHHGAPPRTDAAPARADTDSPHPHFAHARARARALHRHAGPHLGYDTQHCGTWVPEKIQ